MGGITTFVNSLISLNNSTSCQHYALVWKETNSRKFVIDISEKWNKVSAFNQSVKEFNLLLVHSLKPFMIPFIFRNRKKVLVFQHGITFGDGFTKYFKILYYFLVLNFFNLRIVCSSVFSKKKLLSKIFLFNKKNIIIIPFGVIDKKLNVISNTSRKIKIGYAGRLVEQKRIHRIFNALQKISLTSNIEINIAGEGPLQNSLEDLSNRLNNKSIKINFLGYLDNLDKFYNNLDLFILPSKNESYGLVVLEALLHNIPVILFNDSGACTEFIKHQKNGYIINNEDELGELISSLDSINIRNKLKNNIRIMDLSIYNIRNTKLKIDEFI
jgi:glycosyltransferase involved in cell wall biosynthesis